MNNEDFFQMGKTALEQQPFSVLLGAELTAFTGEYAELRITVRREHLQHYGFVHGGVLSYLADNAITFMGAVALGMNVITQEFKINYLRPVKEGAVLIARASLVYGGKRQAVCRCDVFALVDGEERLCAAAQGTILTTG